MPRQPSLAACNKGSKIIIFTLFSLTLCTYIHPFQSHNMYIHPFLSHNMYIHNLLSHNIVYSPFFVSQYMYIHPSLPVLTICVYSPGQLPLHLIHPVYALPDYIHHLINPLLFTFSRIIFISFTVTDACQVRTSNTSNSCEESRCLWLHQPHKCQYNVLRMKMIILINCIKDIIDDC